MPSQRPPTTPPIRRYYECGSKWEISAGLMVRWKRPHRVPRKDISNYLRRDEMFSMLKASLCVAVAVAAVAFGEDRANADTRIQGAGATFRPRSTPSGSRNIRSCTRM